jgi:hypothetical protein
MVTIKSNDFNTCFTQHFSRHLISIPVLVIDFFYAGIDDHFGTYGTWQICTEETGALYGNAVKCSLDDGILFGMDTAAKFMPLS